MPYIKIPKDTSGYKPKFALGLTLRQMITVIVAVICGIGLFYLLGIKLNLPKDLATWSIVIITIPAFFIGFVQIDGLPIEKWLWRRFRFKKNVDHRKYQIKNMYEMLQYEEIEREKRIANETKKRKK